MYTRKHFNFVRTALMLFFALFVSSNAWADAPTEEIGNDGHKYTFKKDGSGNYLINNVDDWNGLATVVEGGYNCAGKTFKLTTNIDDVSTPLGGSETARFAGTFDGGGYTINVTLDIGKYCAPFACVSNVTIRNLHITGSITASGEYASGLIGSSGNDSSDGACLIENCQVSVTITSKKANNPRHGGFIGVAQANATISNSTFDGGFAVEGSGTFVQSGGFIGLNKGTATKFTNCLFNPTSFVGLTAAITDGAGQFAYNFAGSPKGKISNESSNYYYVTAFGTEQGTKVDYAFYDNAVNTLTADTDKKVLLWGRTLKKDGKWNTLCLPFSMTNQQVTDQLNPTALMELDNSDQDGTNLANNGTLTLKFKDATRIEAGKPYIVKWDSGDDLVNPVFTGVNIYNAAPTPVVSNDGKVTFVGQYSPFEIVTSGASGDNQGNKDDIIIVSGNNKVGYSQNPRTLRCFRAHFKVPANSIYSAPVMNIVFNTEGSETTGINTVNGSEFKVNDEYYNLAGQRVAQPAKGLYIVNGRKVVIK